MGAARGVLRGKFRVNHRGAINSKRGNKNFYKGKGAMREGHHTKHGNYVMEPRLMLDIQVPDMTDFQVRPPTCAWLADSCMPYLMCGTVDEIHGSRD